MGDTRYSGYMVLLPVESIHPALRENHDKLANVVVKRSGLLAEFPTLAVYLQVQLSMLAKRDVMFAHDCSGDPNILLRYAEGEMVETGELIPAFSGLKGPSVKDKYKLVYRRVGKTASMEGGDVWWFLAMGEGLRQLFPETYKLSKEAQRNKTFLLTALEGLALRYPGFRPEDYAKEVREKNETNWPDRALRADPNNKLEQMAHEFQSNRFPALKSLRSGLRGRKIPPIIHKAIQGAYPAVPKLSKVHELDEVVYQRVVGFAQDASRYYAY